MGSTASSSAVKHLQICLDMNSRKPEPGDLIEIHRGMFQHWAIYIGNGNVVHLVVPDLGSGSSAALTPGAMGNVLKEKLSDVVGEDHWRINNSLDKKYEARSANVIVKEACSLVGASLSYDLVNSNCEHFVNELRYGKAKSRQVQDAAVAGAFDAAGILTGVVKVVGAIVGVMKN